MKTLQRNKKLTSPMQAIVRLAILHELINRFHLRLHKYTVFNRGNDEHS